MKSELVDLSRADMRGVSTKALEKLARQVDAVFTRSGIESIKTAVYSPGDTTFGLGRVYEVWSDASPELVNVFRDRQKAINWLCE